MSDPDPNPDTEPDQECVQDQECVPVPVRQKVSGPCGSGSTTLVICSVKAYLSPLKNKYQLVPTILELPLRTSGKKCQNYLKRNVEFIRVVDGDNTLVCGLILVVEICTQSRALHLAHLISNKYLPPFKR
jgi:hypothetical protein